MKKITSFIGSLVVVLVVVVATVYVNASVTTPTCPGGSTTCNLPIVIKMDAENQVKVGKFSSTGYALNNIGYEGFINSMTNIETGGEVMIGAIRVPFSNPISYDATGHGGLRVINGFSWFKNPIYIGAGGDVTAGGFDRPPNYGLELMGTTNIGLGDYCGVRASQLDTQATALCPTAAPFGPSLMTYYRSDAAPVQIAVRCSKLAPTTNSTPQMLGYCHLSGGPDNVTIIDTPKPPFGGPGGTCTKTHELMVTWTGSLTTPIIKWTKHYYFATSPQTVEPLNQWHDLGNYYIADDPDNVNGYVEVAGYRFNPTSVPHQVVTVTLTDNQFAGQTMVGSATIDFPPLLSNDCTN